MYTFIRKAHPLPKSKIPVSKMTPEQVAEYRAAHQQSKDLSNKWMAENPRSADNIVAHWDQTTPEHKDQGMSWYADAHHAAKVIARDHGITPNQAAGLIANYSPQQHWAQNLRMASLAAGGQIIGGKKDPNNPGAEGFMASAAQAQAAQRILGGEDYHNIFKGQKITAFGHLIEHGQDTDPNDPQVVVDRHALGVAHGGYADDGIYTHSGISSKKPVYNEISQMYKDAADTINARDGGHNGVPVQPHQLQAATWLTRQRLNMEGGYSGTDNGAAGNRVKAAAEGSTRKWNEYAAQNHPELVNKVPGTGFSASVGQGGMANPEQFGQKAIAKVAGSSQKNWRYDSVSDQYKTSDLQAKFACNCGAQFAPNGFHKCTCGKSYASFDIIPQDKTAASITRIVRPVQEHRDRILANRRTASFVRIADMAGIIGGEGDRADQSKDPADNTDFFSADSKEQEPDRSNSADISNEFTEGVEPTHNPDSPFFVRKDHSDDAAPVVFDKESTVHNFVRKANPTVPRHLDPTNPGGPQWQQHTDDSQSVRPAIGLGTMNHELDNPRPHVQGFPGAGQANQSLRDTSLEGQSHQVLQNEVENNLALDKGKHHSESPGLHRAESSKMTFNEEDFKLGYAHANNDGQLPKTASRSFLEGYVAALDAVVGDRAPGWDTVAPAFEKPKDGVLPTMSDFTDAKPATDNGEYEEVRHELGDKIDRQNAQGQSRDDQGSGINRPTTDLEGWKHSSTVDLSRVHTAQLAREIARRSAIEEA